MGAQHLRLLGCGLSSPLGGAVAAAAAARAGIVRVTGDPDLMVGEPGGGAPVPLHLVRGLTDGFAGRARLAQLVRAALEDPALIGAMPTRGRIALILVLDDLGERIEAADRCAGEDGEHGHDAEVRAGTAESLQAWSEHLLSVATQGWHGAAFTTRETIFGSHTAGAEALDRCAIMFAERTVDACLILAVASLADPEGAEALLAADLLRTADQPHGYTPGEAAAALLISGSGTGPGGLALHWARRGGATGDDLTTTAGRLAEMVDACLPGAAGGLLHDANGEPWRDQEWGRLGLLRRWVAGTPRRMVAESCGEVGAAYLPVTLILASQAEARQYAPSNGQLVLASDRNGARAAVFLSNG